MVLSSFASSLTLTIVMCVFAYFIGSIPNGLWVGKKFKGIDIRDYGSGNIGTTNSIRILGKKLGFFVFILDVIKGMLAIFVVEFILEPTGCMDSKVPYVVYGLCSILGHAFSCFLKFKGGKSVATSLGVVAILTPIPAISCLVVFGIVLLITGYVCLCSSFAAITVVATSWILHFVGMDDGWILEVVPLHICIIYSFVAAFLIYKHKSNFVRLYHGTENCFKKKKVKTIESEITNQNENNEIKNNSEEN
jgi:acyl phosphate:glycerol-3-phosphate acyltransferase